MFLNYGMFEAVQINLSMTSELCDVSGYGSQESEYVVNDLDQHVHVSVCLKQSYRQECRLGLILTDR